MAQDKKSAAENLRTKINALCAAGSDAKGNDATGSQAWKDAFDQVAAAWQTLRGLTQGTNSTDIGEFFKNIGSGLIEAQQKLDVESENYVRRSLRLDEKNSDAPAPPPGMATMFRIPRINAELKCSIETDNEKKLNLVFYSDRNDVRELHQQTVQLEVVSVPAPADYINYLRATSAPKSDAGDTLADDEGRVVKVPASGEYDHADEARWRKEEFPAFGPDDEPIGKT